MGLLFALLLALNVCLLILIGMVKGTYSSPRSVALSSCPGISTWIKTDRSLISAMQGCSTKSWKDVSVKVYGNFYLYTDRHTYTEAAVGTCFKSIYATFPFKLCNFLRGPSIFHLQKLTVYIFYCLCVWQEENKTTYGCILSHELWGKQLVYLAGQVHPVNDKKILRTLIQLLTSFLLLKGARRKFCSFPHSCCCYCYFLQLPVNHLYPDFILWVCNAVNK